MFCLFCLFHLLMLMVNYKIYELWVKQRIEEKLTKEKRKYGR